MAKFQEWYLRLFLLVGRKLKFHVAVGKSPFRLSQEETLVPPPPLSQFSKGWVLFLEEVCTTSRGSEFFMSQTEKTRLRHKGESWLAQTSTACTTLWGNVYSNRNEPLRKAEITMFDNSNHYYLLGHLQCAPPVLRTGEEGWTKELPFFRSCRCWGMY